MSFQMNRKTLYTVAIGVLLFFLIFNPFSRRKNNTKVPMAYVSEETLTELTQHVKENYRSPETLIIETFTNHDVVFVGELNHIKQQVEFLSGLIPELYENGIRHIGVDFALYRDQNKIDQILTASSYDEKAVNEVLFDRMVIWGFKEYADLFREAWRFNRTLRQDQPPFRIVGLNVYQYWEFLEKQRDINNLEVVSKIFSDGIPDEYMADTIRKEFVAKKEKALIYIRLQHAFTRYISTQYKANAEKLGLEETGRAGNIVHKLIGDRAATILLHSPWPNSRSQTLTAFPADGVIDRVIDELPENQKRAGFKMEGTPFGALRVGANDFSTGYKQLTLQELCDGYVILGPFSEYKAVTAIPNFITDANIEEAIRNFPGESLTEISVEDMNVYLTTITANVANLMENFAPEEE
jgi:hypothetical protein